MPSREELMGALRNADAAGDTEAAQRFADMISALPSGGGAGRGSVNPTLPAAQKNVSATRLLARSVLPEGAGDAAADAVAGVGKSGIDTATSILNAHPAYKFSRMLGLIKGKDIDEPGKQARAYAKEQYDEAGPVAGLAKFGTDLALGARAGNAAGTVTNEALQGSNALLRGGATGAAAGAAGAGVVGPGEDESRLQNAVQGAAGGLVIGSGAAAARPALKHLRELAPTAGSAAERAVRALEKALGSKGAMDSVSANLQNPRRLPMTTAAAAESPGLSQIESQARGAITPRTRARWENVDRQTSEAAWDEFQNATRRATDLDATTSARDAIVPGLHAKLDKTVVSKANRNAIVQELEGLRSSPEFVTNDAANMELNRLMANVMDQDFKLGSLAYYLERIDKVGNYTPGQKEQLGKVLHGTINQLSKGQYSQAMDELAVAGKDTSEARAANRLVNDFMGEGGTVKGRTGNEIPQVTSDRVRNAMNKQITNRGELGASDQINPDDKVELNELVRALQQAESARKVPAGKRIQTGSVADALDNAPAGTTTGRAIRSMLRVVTGKRDDATAKAIETALRSPRGWEAILEMSDKNISASDAAYLASILRAGKVSGAAAQKD